MLTAVLLHHVQPPHTVYMPMHLAPDLKRRTGQMLDLAPLLVRIQNPYIIQRAVVCALSAALRKKTRSDRVQRHSRRLFFRS